MASLVIRPCGSGDLIELSRLVSLTIKKCYPVCYSDEVVQFFLKYHSKEEIVRKSNLGLLLVGHLNSQMVATGYLLNNEIGGLYVLPEYQKKGFGKTMLNRLIVEAKKKKLGYIWLDATPFSKEMYLNAGFELIEERVDFIHDSIPLKYFYMEKVLSRVVE